MKLKLKSLLLKILEKNEKDEFQNSKSSDREPFDMTKVHKEQGSKELSEG